MEVYLRKGGTAENYVPFSDEEFQRAKKLLDETPRFDKVADGWYSSELGHIQFSDVPDKQTRKTVHRQVNISTGIMEKDPIFRNLIDVLQPAFVLDIDSKKHELSEFLVD